MLKHWTDECLSYACCARLCINVVYSLFVLVSFIFIQAQLFNNCVSAIWTYDCRTLLDIKECMERHCDSSDNYYVDFLMRYSNGCCSSVLDEVTPLKVKSKPICTTLPWMTEAVLCLRRKCRRTEHLRKFTWLEVHCQYLKELGNDFNGLVKETRSDYFSELISSSKRK